MRRTLAIIAAVSAIPAAQVWALVETKGPPESKPFLQWIITLVVVGAIAAIAFKNAKRSPND
jgi:hypothetical protein